MPLMFTAYGELVGCAMLRRGRPRVEKLGAGRGDLGGAGVLRCAQSL
jgi:hypothetical protein